MEPPEPRAGNVDKYALGEDGVEWLGPLIWKFSKWWLAGEDIEEREDIRDDITSGDAGLILTLFGEGLVE